MTFGPVDEASASYMVIAELIKLCGRNFDPVNVPLPPNFIPGCFAQYSPVSVSEKKKEKEKQVRKERSCKGKKKKEILLVNNYC